MRIYLDLWSQKGLLWCVFGLSFGSVTHPFRGNVSRVRGMSLGFDSSSKTGDTDSLWACPEDH